MGIDSENLLLHFALKAQLNRKWKLFCARVSTGFSVVSHQFSVKGEAEALDFDQDASEDGAA
ncbi:MAG: hypothetical protein U0694_28460 [Anaerolineae bacterium]